MLRTAVHTRHGARTFNLVDNSIIPGLKTRTIAYPCPFKQLWFSAYSARWRRHHNCNTIEPCRMCAIFCTINFSKFFKLNKSSFVWLKRANNIFYSFPFFAPNLPTFFAFFQHWKDTFERPSATARPVPWALFYVHFPFFTHLYIFFLLFYRPGESGFHPNRLGKCVNWNLDWVNLFFITENDMWFSVLGWTSGFATGCDRFSGSVFHQQLGMTRVSWI